MSNIRVILPFQQVNVKTKEVKSWDVDNCYPSEPVFIPRPDTKREDDGVVLSAVIGVKGQRSFLLVLNGENMREVARAYIPVKLVPLFHGEFLQDVQNKENNPS